MRTEFERRPALLLLIGLVIGLTAPTFLANLAFVVAGVVLLRSLPARVWLACGFCVGAIFAPRLPAAVVIAPSPVSGRFTVTSPPVRLMSGGSTFQIESARRCLEAKTSNLVPVLGDEVIVNAEAKPLPQEYQRTYLARGVTAVVNAKPNELEVVKHATGPMAWGSQWRESFVDFSLKRLNGEDAGVVSALAFDVRTGLDLPTRTALEQSGTVHVVAASGIQLLTLAWLLEFLLVRLPTPYLIRRTIVLGLCGLFSAAGGLHPGTFRALVSTAMRDGAVMSGRSFDGLSALGVAGVAYLLWRPNMVFDAGFQLSMILGAGIVLFRARTTGMSTFPRLTKGSLSIWLVSLPIVANLFGVVSLVSIPANIIASVLMPICFLGLLAGHAASFVSESLTQVILAPALLAAHGLEAVVHGFGLWSGWGFRVPPFSGYWLVPIYGAAVALWKPREAPIS